MIPSAETPSSPSSCCDTLQQRSCSSPSSSSSSQPPEEIPEKWAKSVTSACGSVTTGGLTSLLHPNSTSWCRQRRSELDPSELRSSPLDSLLLWMASRSSSFTSGVKLLRSSRVRGAEGVRQGTRAEQLMSASEGPECCSIILEREACMRRDTHTHARTRAHTHTLLQRTKPVNSLN